jgi:Flp pilus assembly protein TadB
MESAAVKPVPDKPEYVRKADEARARDEADEAAAHAAYHAERQGRTVGEHIATLDRSVVALYVIFSAVLLVPYVAAWFLADRDVLALATVALYTWFVRAALKALWRGRLY